MTTRGCMRVISLPIVPRCSLFGEAVEKNIPATVNNRHRFLADEKKITEAPGATPVSN